GIMQDADGLKPSSAGKRVKFSDSAAPSVVDGPFAETKELVAGYWIWNVKSLDEAVEWAKRCPNPMPGEEGVLEIRPCYSLEDLSDIAPKAEFEREARLRKQVARQKKAKGKGKSKAAPARKKSAKKKAKRAK
ncbi:MAG TPA: YciI family protein, partial [Burkholderiales bacterium]|nr:YciI family protein [Burkholderiales bacterium]